MLVTFDLPYTCLSVTFIHTLNSSHNGNQLSGYIVKILPLHSFSTLERSYFISSIVICILSLFIPFHKS